MTVLLTAEVWITAGVTHHFKIGIQDLIDEIFDSAVFLESWSEKSWPELSVPGTATTSSTNIPPIPE